MKKVLIVAGGVLAVVVAVYAIFAVVVALQAREIRAYADAAIVDIASNWNEQALLQRASPELFATTNRQQVNDVFVKYRQLGRLTSLSKGMGHLDVVYKTAGIRMVSVYIARARFERCSVAVKLSLIRHKGVGWQIMGFDIMPDRPPNRGTFGTTQLLSSLRPAVAGVGLVGY